MCLYLFEMFTITIFKCKMWNSCAGSDYQFCILMLLLVVIYSEFTTAVWDCLVKMVYFSNKELRIAHYVSDIPIVEVLICYTYILEVLICNTYTRTQQTNKVVRGCSLLICYNITL